MEQRKELVREWTSTRTITELCEELGISRKTAYKWQRRYDQEGDEGLKDRSRVPHRRPHALREELCETLLGLKRRFPNWGARKVVAYLRRKGELSLPAPSTVHDLFQREGLTVPRRRRLRPAHPGRPSPQSTAPNQLWTTDFKGQFLTGDGECCYPLTVADHYSRFLLGCAGLRSTRASTARQVFERLFRDHGVPDAIQSDNGTPFASSTALCGLTGLNIWWTKLGIWHVRSEPGHPEQNGRHERMHRTLKAETTRPAGATLPQQQQRFDAFRREYNEERPHEGIGNATPASLWVPSPRVYPRRLPEPCYPGHYWKGRVRHNGQMHFGGRDVFVSEALHGEVLGLEEVDEDLWAVYFYQRRLGTLDRSQERVR